MYKTWWPYLNAEIYNGLYFKIIYVTFDGYLIGFCLSVWDTTRINHMNILKYFELFRARKFSIFYLYVYTQEVNLLCEN